MVSWSFFLAMMLSALMGYAIQRGATCMVAVVDEVLNKRRVSRLIALLEASVWVLGALMLSQTLGGHMYLMPEGYAVGPWVVVGAACLGLGAAINGACVFGAIARFGSGEWSYVWAPVGFYLGCLVARMTVLRDVVAHSVGQSNVLHAPLVFLFAIGVWMLWRIIWPIYSLGLRALFENIRARIWAPHAATLVIGVCFVGLLYLTGPWTYTEMLADWSRSGVVLDISRGLLFMALLGGAAWGGWTAGRFKSTHMSLRSSAKCLLGGGLMGAGSLMIPGGNDALILTAMPLLWPYAWVAFLTMFATIAVYLKIQSYKSKRLN